MSPMVLVMYPKVKPMLLNKFLTIWEFFFFTPPKNSQLFDLSKIFMKKCSTVIIFFSKVNFVISDNFA